MTVAITRRDVSVGDLRREAGRTRDAKAARRMLAIACVMEEQSREDAAETCGMDRQTLRDWVHRFNADGLAGFVDLPRRNGPKPRLSSEQEAVVAGWVEQGPDLARDGVVRWRCVDLQDRIEREWGVSLHERTARNEACSCPGKQPAVSDPEKQGSSCMVFPLEWFVLCRVEACGANGKPRPDVPSAGLC